MSDYVTESAEALADELAKHDACRVNEDGWVVCLCGHVAEGDDDDGSHARHAISALIASGVVRPVAEVRAEALREAADSLPTFLDIVRRDHVHKWLHNRAALAEEGERWNPTPPTGGYTSEDF